MKDKPEYENPALNFITSAGQPEPQPESARRRKAGAGRKDCRLNMLVTRELRDRIRALADIDEKSMNRFLNDVITAYVERRRDECEQYSRAAAGITAIRRRARRESAQTQ